MEEGDDFGDLYADLDCPLSSVSGPGRTDSGGEPDVGPKVDLESGFSDYSDSDDDFNIVLNEDECVPAKNTAGRDGDRDDEGGNVGGDLRSNDVDDRKMEKKADERGDITRNGQNSSYAGSRLVGPSSSRTSMSWRVDRDQLVNPCFGGSSSYNRDISAADQRGFCFSLPRNRTIFDINIEAFGKKPWKNHGVDMTEYFNFGMDEESWKSYCTHLDNYRKQVTMPVKYPMYQSNQGDINSFVLENEEKGEYGSDMPTGQAIQVEDGLWERIPSTDKRRPRNHDSDVVIQIPMDGLEQDVSNLYNNSEHVERQIDAPNKDSRKKQYERCRAPFEGKSCKKKIDVSKMNTSRGTSRERTCRIDCKEDEDNNLRNNARKLGVGSSSGDQDSQTSNSYDCENHFKVRKDDHTFGRGSRQMQNAPLRSNARFVRSPGFYSYHSDDSRSDIKTDHEWSRVNTREHNISFGVHRHIRRTGRARVSQSDIDKDEELAYNHEYRKHHNDVNSHDVNPRTRKRKSSYGSDIRGHSSSYKKTETLLTHRSKTYADKNDGVKYHREDSWKGDEIHYERDFDEEYCSNQMESYYSRRHHGDQGMRGFACKQSDRSTIKKRTNFLEKDSCLLLAEGRKERIIMETHFDDNRRNLRYRERHIKLLNRSYIPSHNVEKELVDSRFARQFYSNDKAAQTPVRRKGYDRSCLDFNNSSGFDDIDVIDSRHLDYGLQDSHTVGDSFSDDEFFWHDAGSPNDNLRRSWKPSRRHINQREYVDNRVLKSNKIKCGHDPRIDNCFSSYENNQESDDDYNFKVERVYCDNIVSNVRISTNNGRLKPGHCANDGVRFRYHEQDCLSSPKRSSLCDWNSRNENEHIDQFPVTDKCSPLNNVRKKQIVEGCYGSTHRVNFVSNQGMKELAPVGCREGVNVRMNSWNRKLVKRSTAAEKIDTSNKTDKLGDSRHPKKIHKQEEIQNILVDDGVQNEQTAAEKIDTSYTINKMNDSRQPRRISKKEEIQKRQTNSKAVSLKQAMLTNTDEYSKMPPNKAPFAQTVGDDEIEEGELIEVSDKQDVSMGKNVKIDEKKVTRNSQLRDVKTVPTYDENHILKTLEKMEKRKERFQPLTAPKQAESDIIVNCKAVDPVAVDEVKLQRPARKRRWGGN